MKFLGLPIAAATLLLAGAAHAEICSQQSVARAAALVLDANRTLGALPVVADKETDVSAAGRKAIAAVKDRLNDYTVATMRCAPEKIAASELKKSIDSFAGVKLPEDHGAKKLSLDSPRYGGGPVFDKLSLDVPRDGVGPTFDTRLLSSSAIGVIARIGIACGDDAILMIFERRGGVWTETLRTQSAPYKTVAGGWWAFDYGISPRDKDGRWFVVTKNVAPWCSSTWSEIRYAVVRPGADAAHPHALLSKTDSIWWDPGLGDLKVDARGFDLRWRAESMDDGVHNREWIAHYIVDDDRVHRTAPIAENPRDFADEWLRLDWKDAKHWTAVSAYGLKRLHDKLRKVHNFDYVAVRRCSDENHTQVEVEPALAEDDRHTFFQVFDSGPLYMMSGVSRSRDRRCNGTNLFSLDHP